MKKIFTLFLLMLSIVLVSCSSGEKQDLKSLRKDEVSDEIKTQLNITFDETTGSKKIYTKERENDSYYDIYVAEDINASLFSYSYDITKDIDKHLKKVLVNTLTFADSMYSDEMAAYLKEFYAKEYGVTKLGLNFTPITDDAWTKNLYDSVILDAANDNVENIEVSIVYLPTLFVRTYKGNEILKVYVFVPVYVKYLSDGKEIKEKDDTYELVDYTNPYKEVELLFDTKEPGYLASKIETVEE